MNFNKKPLTVVLGAAFALAGSAQAGNLFQATDLGAGYMLAAAGDDKKADHKCGEAKCGADAKKADHKCGEGKCGADAKKADHKCGEGKCGADAKKPQ